MLIKPLSPLWRLTLALVSICAALVMLADTLLDAFPNRAEQQLELRQQIGKGIAIQTASLLRRVDDQALRQILDQLRNQVPGAQSLVLRRANGNVMLATGAAVAEGVGGVGGAEADLSDDRSTADRIRVPLIADGKRWGRLEINFQPDPRPLLLQWLAEPMVATLLMVTLVGALIIGLYLRRALQHLDPRAVIPERVQGAFDVMNEGVVVLDGRGRVVLANKAFHALHPNAAELKLGQALSALAWLTQSLPPGTEAHPWMRTLKAGAAVSGLALEITDPSGQVHPLLVNTMPINDGGGKVRGCLASFTDQTPVHRANLALRQAMAELSASKKEVQQQNETLQQLATRDPLTGCLNRRAFNDALAPLFERARTDGTPLSAVMLDIDFFKKVNDSHGHGIGDRVIQEVARKLSDCARGSDLVCRYGGEEFVLVLPGLAGPAALAVAERVRQRVQAECGPAVREVPGMQVTVSLGVATLATDAPQPVLRPDGLIDQADQALYSAKRGGRNRVVHADQALANAASEATITLAAPAQGSRDAADTQALA